jgi:hypothetical protein
MEYGVDSIRDTLRNAFPNITPAHVPEGHRYKNEQTQEYAWSVTTKLGFVAKGYLPRWYAKRTSEHIRENLSALCEGDLSILDEAINAGETSRNESGGIGTTAHGAIERYLDSWIESGSRPSTATAFLDDSARGEEIAACRSFDRLNREIEIIPLASELKIWYGYGRDSFAGTVDAVLLVLSVHKGRCGAEGIVDLYGKEHTVHDYVHQKGRLYWCAACGREVKARLVLADWKTSNNIKEKDDYAQQDEAYAKSIEKKTGLKFDELWVVRLDKHQSAYEICKVNDRKAAWNEFIKISRAFDERQKRTEYLLAPLQAKAVIKI